MQPSETQSHPKVVDLEALAAGDAHAAASAHVEGCASCAATVAKLRAEIGAFRETAKADEFIDQVVARANRTPRTLPFPATRRFAPIVAAFALAAGLWLFLRPPTRQPIGDAPTNGSGQPQVTFKGSAEVFVIRDRDGRQSREIGPVKVRNGDRIRAEVSVEQAGPMTAVLVSSTGSTLVLLPPTWLEPGVHFTPESVRFDAERFDGTLWVGSPEAVATGRAAQPSPALSAKASATPIGSGARPAAQARAIAVQSE